MDWLTAVLYALSKGFWAAYFDAKKEAEYAREEEPSDEDLARARNMRAAVERLRDGPQDDSQRENPASRSSGGVRPGLGTVP